MRRLPPWRRARRPHLGANRQGPRRWPAIDGRPDPVEARSLRVDVVAFSGTPEEARIVRKVIAERAGPIVPLVSEVLNPAAYAHERAVCVDTTAAGGNASRAGGCITGSGGRSDRRRTRRSAWAPPIDRKSPRTAGG
ncbi:hypothetical protein ACVOMV_12285 [Mesorhizobium atlanticum]